MDIFITSPFEIFSSMARALLMRRALQATAAALARQRQRAGNDADATAGAAAAALLLRANAVTAAIGRARRLLSTSTTSTTSTSAYRCSGGDRGDSPYEYDAPVSLSEIHRRRNAVPSASAAPNSRRARARVPPPPPPPPRISLDIDDGSDDDDDDSGEEEKGEGDDDRNSKYNARFGGGRGQKFQRRLGGAAVASISSPSTTFASSSSSSNDAAAYSSSDASAAARKVTRALNSAAGSLSRRPHSRSELERKLRDRGHSAEASSLALEKLRNMGLLPTDREFARAFARAKFRAVAWGPARIKVELVRGRGVSAEDASAALRDIFGVGVGSPSFSPALFVDTDEEDDEAERVRGERNEVASADGEGEDDGESEDPRSCSSESSVFEASWDPIPRKEQATRLLEAAERQVHLSRGLPLAARRRRLAGWLARRGHGWKTAAEVFERVGL